MRFVLNFNYKCSLNCEWCYVNFNAQNPKKEIIFKIINKFVDNGYKIITIGGGDPFNYDWIFEVIVFSKEKGLFVHIDSNMILLNETDINKRILNENVDLIGIPLDASNSRTHDLVRNKKGHYNLIKSKIDWLSFMVDRLKINTFVNSKNIDNLDLLSDDILSINPRIWSLYQYCSVYHNDDMISKYYVNDQSFNHQTSKIIDKLNRTSIDLELTYSTKRVKKYPIVSSDGIAEILVEKDKPYLILGSIFIPSTMDKIKENCFDSNNERYIL